MDTEEKLRDSYQCFWTFRRTSDTRALEKKVSELDMDIVNRWKAVETAAGRVPGWLMWQHYDQLELLLGPFLCYTFAMWSYEDYSFKLSCLKANQSWYMSFGASKPVRGYWFDTDAWEGEYSTKGVLQLCRRIILSYEL